MKVKFVRVNPKTHRISQNVNATFYKTFKDMEEFVGFCYKCKNARPIFLPVYLTANRYKSFRDKLSSLIRKYELTHT